MRNGVHAGAIPRSARQPSISSSRTASSNPSLQPFTQPIDHPPRTKRLKSQYPAGSAERHVEYILVASFHIDQGPIMEHQYPGAISGDENMLAELMLPDQAHVRNQDWTIFFLHKDSAEEESKPATQDAEGEQPTKKKNDHVEPLDTDEETDPSESTDGEEGRRAAETVEEQDVEGGEGPPLIYVLNLVNTKQDTTAKRLPAFLNPFVS